MARNNNRSKARKNKTQRGIGSHSLDEIQHKAAAIKAQAALNRTKSADASVKDPATPHEGPYTPDNATTPPASESGWISSSDEVYFVASGDVCRPEAEQEYEPQSGPPTDESSPVDEQSQARDDTAPAEDSIEQALHFLTTSKEDAPVPPTTAAAFPPTSPAPAMPAPSSADSTAEHQGDVKDAVHFIEQPSQVPASCRDPSPVAPTPSAALPATTSAVAPSTSPPDSTSDIEVEEEALCTADPHQEGLSSDARQPFAGRGPTLPLTKSEEKQSNGNFDAHADCHPVLLTPPVGGSSSTRQDEGKEVAEIAEQWPRGLSGWALLLCGRLQIKTPTAVRPLVDLAVAAAVEVLAATTALSAICF